MPSTSQSGYRGSVGDASGANLTLGRDTLTRLAALGALSRNAGEGLQEVQPQPI